MDLTTLQEIDQITTTIINAEIGYVNQGFPTEIDVAHRDGAISGLNTLRSYFGLTEIDIPE